MIVSLNISVAKYVPIFLFRMSCLINKIWSISSKMWVSSQNEQKKKKKKKKKKEISSKEVIEKTSSILALCVTLKTFAGNAR